MCDDEAMYSDEYDDTYDEDGGVVNDIGDDTGRQFVVPRALQKNIPKAQQVGFVIISISLVIHSIHNQLYIYTEY